MSTPIYAYAIPFEWLYLAWTGQKEMVAKFRAALGADCTEPVERFFARKPLVDGDETVNVLERLCQALGRRMPGPLGGGITTTFMEKVDKALADGGMPDNFRLSNLVFAGPPFVNLPDPPESPSVGYITEEVLAMAIERFAAEPPTSDDSAVDEVLSVLEDWASLCRTLQANVPPLGLIGIWG